MCTKAKKKANEARTTRADKRPIFTRNHAIILETVKGALDSYMECVYPPEFLVRIVFVLKNHKMQQQLPYQGRIQESLRGTSRVLAGSQTRFISVARQRDLYLL